LNYILDIMAGLPAASLRRAFRGAVRIPIMGSTVLCVGIAAGVGYVVLSTIALAALVSAASRAAD
jgi:hypothetical protein